MFLSLFSPRGSDSIVFAAEPRVRVSKMAPKFPTGLLSYDILLCLKCHLRKKPVKYVILSVLCLSASICSEQEVVYLSQVSPCGEQRDRHGSQQW